MKDFKKIKLGKDYVGHRMLLGEGKLLHIVAPEYKTIDFRYFCIKEMEHKYTSATVVAPFQCWSITYDFYCNTHNGYVQSTRLAFALEDPIKNPKTSVYQSWVPNCGYHELFDICLGESYYDISRNLDGDKLADKIRDFAFNNYNYFWNSNFNTDLSPKWNRSRLGTYYQLSNYLDTNWTIEYIQSEEFKKKEAATRELGIVFKEYASS